MSGSRHNEKTSQEDEWAFVDMQGAIVPKEKIKPPKSKMNVKRRKRVRSRKEESEQENDPDFEVIKDGGLTTSTIIATTKVPPFRKDFEVIKDGGLTMSTVIATTEIPPFQKDFEVIKDGGLTMSTVIATTEIPPFKKETDVEEAWGIVENSRKKPISHPGPAFSHPISQNADSLVEVKLESSDQNRDIEFVEIPEEQIVEATAELLSDTSSTCSFDVIDENKSSVLTDSEKVSNDTKEIDDDDEEDDDDDDCDDDDDDDCDDDDDDDNDDDDDDGDGDNSSDIDMIAAEFHFDFPTIVALFCLTTVLGFVIGHGVGIASSLLVVKSPNLKAPLDVTRPKTEQTTSEENKEQSQNSQLEGKVQKWKSLYRNEKQPGDESALKILGNLPGLKEAHKQLSLENYKLKRAYSDIQKQLELMKVMSWRRRAQLDKLRQNNKINMSHVVGILKNELEYLEAVYFREKRLADMWRNEDRVKSESGSNPWKEFKERWSDKYKDSEDERRRGVCMDNQDCEGDTRTAEDTSGYSIKEPVDHTGTLGTRGEELVFNEELVEQAKSLHRSVKHIRPVEKRETFLSEEAEDTTNRRGDFGTVEDTSFPKREEIRHGYQKPTFEERNYIMDEENTRNSEEQQSDSLFWRHLRLAKTSTKDSTQTDVHQTDLPSENEAVNDKTTSEDSSNNVGDGSDDKQLDENSDMTTGKDDKKNSPGLLAQTQADWFSYEVLEHEEHIIIACENKDSLPHVFYAFIDKEFREIESGPGDIFVMSMKAKCFDLNSSFVVSLLNNSPKPIHFFALLPNGKIKHQKIAEQVKVSIVELGSKGETEARPLIYEASVLENGKLHVGEQNDGESEAAIDENQNEDLDSKYGDESGDEHKAENNEFENPRDSAATQEGESMTPQLDQEVPLSSLTPGASHIFDQSTGNIYKRTVSSHQYPISEYETLLAQLSRNREQVYYRFPRTAIVEKFIVNDEVVHMNNDGSTATSGDDEGPTEDTAGHGEPLQHEEDVSKIVQRLLKNPWKDSHRLPVLMTYDSTTGTVTSSYVILSKVQADDVISHDVLKYGKILRIDEMKLMKTSYLLHRNELLRVVREDEVKHGFTKIENKEEEKGHGYEVSNNENFSNSKNKEENSGNSNEGNEHYSNSKNEIENFGNSEKQDENSSDPYDFPQQNSSEASTHEDSPEESHHEECVLRLGERDTNEHWTYTTDKGAAFIRETVERVIPTAKYKEEDFSLLHMTTNDVEESVSYVYCDDGSVQKTWRRTDKVSRTVAREGSVQLKNTEDGGMNDRDEDGTKDDDDYNEKHDDIDDDMDDLDDDIDDIDDDIDDIDDDIHDDIDDVHDIDDDIDDDIHDVNIDLDNDDDYRDEHYGRKEDDIDNEIDSNNTDIYSKHDNDGSADNDADHLTKDSIYDDNIRDKATPIQVLYNHKEIIHKRQKEEHKGKLNNGSNFSNDHEKSNNLKERKDLDKENYETFIMREWQNLKLRQQQFEQNKKQNQRLQQQMLGEWNKMKELYKELQNNFQKSRKSDRDLEIEGLWQDLKNQQKQFDNLKKEIEDEVRASLKVEWEKLKKKQEEIELREKVLRYQGVSGYQWLTQDHGKDIKEHVKTKWESNYDRKVTSYPKLLPEISTGKENEYLSKSVEEVNKLASEVVNEILEVGQDKMESKSDTLASQTQELTDETKNPNNAVENGNVDITQSQAWEMTESDTQIMEENLPHELPYIIRAHENLVVEHYVDTMRSDAWDSSDQRYDTIQVIEHNPPDNIRVSYTTLTPTREFKGQSKSSEFFTTENTVSDSTSQIEASQDIQEEGNLFQEISYIPSTDTSPFNEQSKRSESSTSGNRMSDSPYQTEANEYIQKENGLSPELSSSIDTSRDNILGEDTSKPADTTDNELSNDDAEDFVTSSKWETQVQKLREQLDKLYEAKTSQGKAGRELQVIKQETESSTKPTEDLSTLSERKVQPKCPPKCPRDEPKENLNKHHIATPHRKEKLKLQRFPKRSDGETKQRPFPRRFGDQTKQESLPKKSKKTKKSSIKKAELSDLKRESYAFLDFVESNSYLRELKPEKYDEKMLGLKNGPISPGKKGVKKKRNKNKFKDDERTSSEGSNKKKHHQKYSASKKGRREVRKVRIERKLPLRQSAEKKSIKQGGKSHEGKSKHK